MEFEIKKKYALSKRNQYGIDNENQIVTQIKKRLIEIIEEKQKFRAEKEKRENEGNTTDEDDDYIEPELDEETDMALKIASNLKELTMKQHIKELLFNKFKS